MALQLPRRTMRYLFCTLASHGYVYPAIGIGLVLRERGHSIAFITDQSFATVLKTAGFDRIPRGVRDGASFQVGVWSRPEGLEAQLEHTCYGLNIFEPDVLLTSQLALGPMIVARAGNVPVAVLGFATFLFPPSTQVLQNASLRASEAHGRYREMASIYLRGCELAGISPPRQALASMEKTPLLGDTYLLQTVPEFLEDDVPLPEHVHHLGSCLWEPGEIDEELHAWLTTAPANTPVLYVQHGRSFGRRSFWPYLVEALAGEPIRVVAVTSRMDIPSGTIPSNFFVRHHIPQGQILAVASAVVCNATTTAVLGAITHGLPLLLVPGGSAQPELARCCEKAGIAVNLLPENLSAAAITSAIDAIMLSDCLRRRARSLQSAFSRAGGAARAADVLEGLAKPKGDVQYSCKDRY